MAQDHGRSTSTKKRDSQAQDQTEAPSKRGLGSDRFSARPSKMIKSLRSLELPGLLTFKRTVRLRTQAERPLPVGTSISSIRSKNLQVMASVTQILSQIESGDPSATHLLLPLVYDELRSQAARELRREGPGQTLQATALVHEAYVRLVGVAKAQNWQSRKHFFAAAAQAMRRILVDRARQKLSLKGGGEWTRMRAYDEEAAKTATPAEVVAVHDALDDLAAEDSLAAELVKLHYFSGFSIEEGAEILQISRATAYRVWTYARAWLRTSLRSDDLE